MFLSCLPCLPCLPCSLWVCACRWKIFCFFLGFEFFFPYGATRDTEVSRLVVFACYEIHVCSYKHELILWLSSSGFGSQGWRGLRTWAVSTCLPRLGRLLADGGADLSGHQISFGDSPNIVCLVGFHGMLWLRQTYLVMSGNNLEQLW